MQSPKLRVTDKGFSEEGLVAGEARMNLGKQVLLYLVDGKPGGLRTAEIANWTGHIVAAPRAEFTRLLSRDEAKRTGIYLLFGDDPEASQPGQGKVYVGESDEVASRLRQHHEKKDWWDRVVVVTSQAQAQQLKKHEVRYLESQLISRAKQTARATLDNNTDPGFALLSEAETSNMDYFLAQLHVVLPAIGVDVFRGVGSREASGAPTLQSESSPVFHLSNAKRGVTASAQLIDGEFLVLTGSVLASAVLDSEKYSDSTRRGYANYRAIRDELAAKGILVVEGGVSRLAKDAPFSSPSTAGSVVLGRSCNGRKEWVNDDGVSFGDWEGRDVSTPTTESGRA